MHRYLLVFQKHTKARPSRHMGGMRGRGRLESCSQKRRFALRLVCAHHAMRLYLRGARNPIKACFFLLFALLAMPILPAHHARLSTGPILSHSCNALYHRSYSLSLCSRPPTIPDPNFLYRLPTFSPPMCFLDRCAGLVSI